VCRRKRREGWSYGQPAAIFGSGGCPPKQGHVVGRKDSNGATRPHRSKDAVALASFVRTVQRWVMASDGDCALRSAIPIASFDCFGRNAERLTGTVAATQYRALRKPLCAGVLLPRWQKEALQTGCDKQRRIGQSEKSPSVLLRHSREHLHHDHQEVPGAPH
jgi:hypothetical protein